MKDKTPVVVIAGLPNVGKSSLFNRIVRKRKAIVHERERLTRDIIRNRVVYDDFSFELVDSGGYIEKSLEELDDIAGRVVEKTIEAIGMADLVVYMVDIRAIASGDMHLARLIKEMGKECILVGNKADNTKLRQGIGNLYELGFDEVVDISVLQGYNIDLLLDMVVNKLKLMGFSGKAKDKHIDISIALVGKPNVGKSSLLNLLVGYDRAIVSAIPGTTRDMIDEVFRFHGKNIRVVDSAGIRRKTKIRDNIEYYSIVRSERAIKESDVVYLIVDATEGIGRQDKKIAHIIMENYKPCVIAINKWDLLPSQRKEGMAYRDYMNNLLYELRIMSDVPIITISCKEKKRISKLIEIGLELNEKAAKRIKSSWLNHEFDKWKGDFVRFSKIKVYSIFQVGIKPPTFVIFVNNKRYFKENVRRYVLSKLKSTFGFENIPIKLVVRDRKRLNK